jgi:hypothetical protein
MERHPKWAIEDGCDQRTTSSMRQQRTATRWSPRNAMRMNSKHPIRQKPSCLWAMHRHSWMNPQLANAKTLGLLFCLRWQIRTILSFPWTNPQLAKTLDFLFRWRRPNRTILSFPWTNPQLAKTLDFLFRWHRPNRTILSFPWTNPQLAKTLGFLFHSSQSTTHPHSQGATLDTRIYDGLPSSQQSSPSILHRNSLRVMEKRPQNSTSVLQLPYRDSPNATTSPPIAKCPNPPQAHPNKAPASQAAAMEFYRTTSSSAESRHPLPAA